MFERSYKVASVWGIPIKLHISLPLLVLYFGLRNIRELGWGMSISLCLAFLASIALHELGHSFVALRKGCQVREITLMLMGGVAQMTRIPRRPRDEFLMAIAGPAVSALLGGLLLAAGYFLYPLAPAAGFFLLVAGALNLGLCLFNLLPAFPLDGGRVFRALLTPKLGRLKATFVAARIGQVLSALLALYALYPPFNLWPILVAAFVAWAARAEYRAVAMQETMRGMGIPDPWSDQGEDRVRISPPPYAQGRRDTHADLHSADL